MSEDSSNLSQNLSIHSEKQRSEWWLAPVALFSTIILFYAAQIIGALMINLAPTLGHWSAARTNNWLVNSTSAQFFYGLIADGLLVVGIAAMLRLLRWRWTTIGLRAPKLWHIALGVLAVIPYYILYLVVVGVVSIFVPTLNIGQKQDIGFESVHGFLSLAMAFASLVILPPLAEEITMRGYLYTGLKKWLPRIVAGLLVSGLFGAAHLAEGGSAGPLWIGAIDTFTLSIVLVSLRELTGNLWAGIVLHAAKNAVAFVSLFILHVH